MRKEYNAGNFPIMTEPFTEFPTEFPEIKRVEPTKHSYKRVNSTSKPNILLSLVLAAILGLLAWYFSRFHPALDALPMAIILGITTRMVIDRAYPRAVPGIVAGAQVIIPILIPLAVILYGVNINIGLTASLPISVILLTLILMLAFYVVIYWLNARVWKLPPKLSELTATGSAICGASAIAILAPSMEAEPEDTSVSLLVITAACLLGVMVYPILAELTQMTNTAYAVLSGATLHQTGAVRAALAGLPAAAASFGMAVKTVRILMLVPVALVTSYLHSYNGHQGTGGRQSTGDANGRSEPNKAGSRRFYSSDRLDLAQALKAIARVWFVIPMIILSWLVSFAPETQTFLYSLRPWSVIAFSIGLASIGLTVDVESVLKVGARPLMVGLLGWIVVVGLFFLLYPLLG